MQQMQFMPIRDFFEESTQRYLEHVMVEKGDQDKDTLQEIVGQAGRPTPAKDVPVICAYH